MNAPPADTCETASDHCDCHMEARDRDQRRVLVALLVINAVMFGVEIVAGLLAQSTGLIADSLDMLADASVYAISLYAVGRAVGTKIRAARLSGVFQIALALVVAVDVVRRFIHGSEPASTVMMAVGALALMANVICLLLIAKHRDGEVHMRASWIFSKNDVIANLGIIAGGLLVAATGSPLPDLLIGLFIIQLVFRGGLRILAEARG